MRPYAVCALRCKKLEGQVFFTRNYSINVCVDSERLQFYKRIACEMDIIGDIEDVNVSVLLK
ncbi:hypothetical protein PK35_03510 [Tamlana nanhaiensis]|uniref:Uncharacterized protein n=1 Tax=Neotamlana nanhaiensis TaxID=1382798 RepID=A0A0D7W488_9FLAO|nr:hypothetical protein [Tamlana nanhaiensis]KJD33829.1 hypothetical protein PK35_03510 [Tamlana nanhaiensis]